VAIAGAFDVPKTVATPAALIVPGAVATLLALRILPTSSATL